MTAPVRSVTGWLHGRFRSPLRGEAVAARLGLALGILFATCAVTGLYSHLHQHPVSWLELPSRPAGLYRVTQTVHVTAGFATIPVLLAKLWAVAPKLLEWPPARSPGHALERVLLLPLVGGALFLLGSGVANVARWYPWTFFFPAAHFAAAWITVGALVVHVGATWAITGRGLRRPDTVALSPGERRRFLGGVAVTSGVLGLAAVGGSVSPLSSLSFLAQRRPGDGPQGLPVNKTAAEAGVRDAARDPAWRLRVVGRVERELRLDRATLLALPQHEAKLPIACVEGWSASATWRGVRVRDLLAMAGAPDDCTVVVSSLQRGGRYRASELNRHHAHDRDTLLATHLEGEELHLDHGFPLRLIGPNRPGVNQTKWVAELEVR